MYDEKIVFSDVHWIPNLIESPVKFPPSACHIYLNHAQEQSLRFI